MAKDYRYGFTFLERDGRKIIRYRQDKLWFASGLAWFLFFQLIALFLTVGTGNKAPFTLAWIALGGLAFMRSRPREIAVGEKDVIVDGKSYDRAKISQLIVEAKNDRQTFSRSAQNYDQIARDVAHDPLGGDPVLAKASAMAADATTSIALLIAGGIDSTGRKVEMVYDGQKIVVARWLSVQRAMMLANALGGYLGLGMDSMGADSAVIGQR